MVTVKSSETFPPAHTLSFCILTVSSMIVSVPFQTSFYFPSFSLVLCFCHRIRPRFSSRCRGEWNNTIRRWWKRPEYFPPNLVFTAHSSQKASCLFLFGWQIIQSERGLGRLWYSGEQSREIWWQPHCSLSFLLYVVSWLLTCLLSQLDGSSST